MPEQSTALGDWVDQLLHDLFFQPDDALSRKRLDESMDPALDLRVNGAGRPLDDWVTCVAQNRAQHEMTRHSSKELLATFTGDGSGGSVSHSSTFTLKNKSTGAETKGSIISIATVADRNGKKLLTQLTEVQCLT